MSLNLSACSFCLFPSAQILQPSSPQTLRFVKRLNLIQRSITFRSNSENSEKFRFVKINIKLYTKRFVKILNFIQRSITFRSNSDNSEVSSVCPLNPDVKQFHFILMETWPWLFSIFSFREMFIQLTRKFRETIKKPTQGLIQMHLKIPRILTYI